MITSGGVSPEKISSEQVIVANGCSGALELALTALLDDDSILIVPNPGFPLYQVICESHGASVLSYNLLADQGWQCDLQHLETLLQQDRHHNKRKKIRGMVVTNPSNPTGSVYSRQHLADICQLAQRYYIPIIADEVYGDLTFGSDNEFHSLADVAQEFEVPVIVASGIGKQYLVPGWRLGWLVFHDK
jgi:tyrosine aminotransferase